MLVANERRWCEFSEFGLKSEGLSSEAITAFSTCL